jgi:N-acetylmuramoyl-L-alanine amidase
MVTGRLRGRSSVCRAPVIAALASAFALVTSAAAQQLPFQIDLPFPFMKQAKEAAPPQPDESTRTRFIISLERPVEFQVTALSNPNRVSIELPQVRYELPGQPGEVPVGVVKSFRPWPSAGGKTRIVIDVTGPVVIEKAVVEKTADGSSHQLVLDIVAAPESAEVIEARKIMRTGASGLGAVGLQPPVPKPALPPQARASYKPTIVIDPGHGGEDSGARKFGTVEKDVVLSFSLKLREKLAATGRYKVLMTRDDDTFVPLEQRREFAEKNQAQLFIAIHADYTDRASARGATVYSLRPQVADSLRRSVQNSDNMLSGKEMAQVKKSDDGAVRQILADLARREVDLNRERTSVFARSVIDFIGGATNLMDNPDRNAAFVVLKTARVPSILLELGYVTNAEDAQQLRSDQWRDRVSSSLVTAIDTYFTQLPM